MSSIRSRTAIWIVLTTWVFFGSSCRERFATEPTIYSFVPGVIGSEPRPIEGRKASDKGPGTDSVGRQFRTRAMIGVPEAWARDNHLTKPLAFSHNLGRIFPPELFQQRPEFFPLADGRRLQPPLTGPLFWNPDLGRLDVAAYAAEAARRQFTAHPEQESFALGVNDALIFGESPENLALVQPGKWFRERPDYSNLVFTFMNRVAEDLSRTHPQKYLGALAYYWAESAPDFRLNSQVVPFLTADRAQGYDASFRDEEFRLQERWAQSGAKRLGLYDYLYGGGYIIPRIHTQLLADNLRHARRSGFTDYNAEVNPNWGLDGPMPWLAAQLLQDPEQSVGVLLDEYYRRYFKEAAEPMRQFFELCEARWMAQPGPPYWLKHYRNESQAIIFPSDVCRQLRDLLDQAEARATGEVVRQRVQLTSRAFGVTERFVAFKEARDRATRMVLPPGNGWRPAALALRDYLVARREFIRTVFVVKHTEPLALTKFGLDDYLTNDPVAGVLLVIREIASAKDELPAADRMLAAWSEPVVDALWRPISVGRKEEKELLKNTAFVDPLLPGRRIAGLEYGVSLPAEWFSRVEPSQYHRAEFLESARGRVLRVAGAKDVSVSQWSGMSDSRGLQRVAISIRGRVSPGTIVSLMFAWMDEKQRHLGFKSVRLPDGDWPDWVALRQAGQPPAGAFWAGIGLRIQNQVVGDWIEARDFQLRASP